MLKDATSYRKLIRRMDESCSGQTPTTKSCDLMKPYLCWKAFYDVNRSLTRLKQAVNKAKMLLINAHPEPLIV